MEIRRFKCKSGEIYNIVNETWETSNSWGHKSTLLTSYEIDSHKVRYLNRTWESYRYESCMLNLIDKILDNNEKSFIVEYKEKNDITRLTADLKEKALEEWNNRTYTQDLKEIKDKIRNRDFLYDYDEMIR